MASAVSPFSSASRRWFVSRFGTPTLAQRLAWAIVSANQNLLLQSPTGSGKTLAAFLPIIDALFESRDTKLQCIYVAPYKALIQDTCKMLRRCAHGVHAFAPSDAPTIRVDSRTGDTSAQRRVELYVKPPHILLSTPESLALLLSRLGAADLFRHVRWIVVDEVHALASTKRGADLALSLERLQALCDQTPQRVGLSATCSPIEEAARFLVGTDRDCALASGGEAGRLDLTIEPLSESEPFLSVLIDRLRPELEANRTTLIFTNTRALAERLTWFLSRRFPQWREAIGVHHSSLAAARRRVVELRLKRGKLRVVVSSTSLELGIDIGSVDCVVLVHPPGDVVRLLQRVGRSGHGPGRTRRGIIYTATPAELLEAVVTVDSGRDGRCENLSIPHHPLDVLCQHVAGMACHGSWRPDDAFDLVRRAYPYRGLPREDFDACIAYLSGRRGDDPNWLPPRLCWEGGRFTIRSERTARLVRRNLGTILAEEPRRVLQDRGTMNHEAWPGDDGLLPVGEVEEAFADGLQPGDRFLLDGRCLELRRFDGPSLVVDEVPGRPRVPRWTGGGWPLASELAERLYLLRIRAAEALREGSLALHDLLRDDYALSEPAARSLKEFFQCQELVSEIPDRGVLLIEVVQGEYGTDYCVHTPLNRRGNEAIVRVVLHRLSRARTPAITSLVADLGFQVCLAGGKPLSPEMFRSLLSEQRFDADLAQEIAASMTLRERFRRVATVGLMLLRYPIGGRRRVGGPDWAERRLCHQIKNADPEFVLLRQARKEVYNEVCDAAGARAFLQELPRKAIRMRHLNEFSPFAASWTQPALVPGIHAETPEDALRRLHAELLSSLVFQEKWN